MHKGNTIQNIRLLTLRSTPKHGNHYTAIGECFKKHPKRPSPTASFHLGCHFDRNEVKGEISPNRKSSNLTLHR